MHDLGYLAQDISILHRSYYKDTAQAFKRLKLNPTAACIMIAVCDSPGINQQRISDYLAIDKGLTAREVAKLESSGYLRRVKGKGKSVSLDATAAGEAIADKARHVRAAWWQTLFSRTGVTQTSELLPGIELIVHTLTGRLDSPNSEIAEA
ncbi:MarR family winged helix-turn-helix transcriptional regulator [Bifidobacterium subtile]|jgi:DNA-binding MarR family transcriptional regulator|uniref:Transcriptional regulator n=1 Tax=Bifidobacterium subtile TaxID=77635 RepID=A0A087EA97_9BIFI|nr:MarR family transcriptional regulator [Bifidobacterium subtile]KFJ04698.1 transcriptional regulator [Bifidobacterium subtile]MCI1222614.1 MarR family transcriptional regulator [Bifidobacterium subtile]MCI1240757.1 MarR family transcriptional regulator [Bifidobacterium subtile]MCI1257690.1 MarR family transcriptional regulator [Bifidobacterium subtile]QOL35787.1 MarR family transcriptional regulator [Bifidobacterium subtile]